MFGAATQLLDSLLFGDCLQLWLTIFDGPVGAFQRRPGPGFLVLPQNRPVTQESLRRRVGVGVGVSHQKPRLCTLLCATFQAFGQLQLFDDHFNARASRVRVAGLRPGSRREGESRRGFLGRESLIRADLRVDRRCVDFLFCVALCRSCYPNDFGGQKMSSLREKDAFRR